MEELQFRVLRLLRDATAAGLVTWQMGEEDNDWFHARSMEYAGAIWFRYPSYTDSIGSDRDYVQVMGVGRFMIGSPGWWLVLEILAAGIPEWAEHLKECRAGLEWQANLLTRALEQRSSEPSNGVDAG